jgi:hypothetical protein
MGARLFEPEDSVRRAERKALDEAARMKPNSWSSLEIQMLDLSQLGFRGACEARLARGGTVTLEIPGVGSVEAQVEWQRGDEFGARFFVPIDMAACQWTMSERREALAQLLVQRAAAAKAGRRGADAQMRRQILASLPIRKVG